VTAYNGCRGQTGKSKTGRDAQEKSLIKAIVDHSWKERVTKRHLISDQTWKDMLYIRQYLSIRTVLQVAF